MTEEIITEEQAGFRAGRSIPEQGPVVKSITVKILKFGTTQTIAILVLKIEKFDVTLH